jgi:hypothetical protein
MISPDWINAVANVVLAGSAAVAAYFGTRGLSAWREQTIGQKRIDLAEDILARLYRARDIIDHARNGFVMTGDADERPNRDHESDSERHYKDQWFVPFKRLGDESVFFSEFNSLRYRAIALFGKEHARTFDDLRQIVLRISRAAKQLMFRYEWTGDKPWIDPNGDDSAYFESLKALVWSTHNENDPISIEINTIVAWAEQKLRPEIERSAKR